MRSGIYAQLVRLSFGFYDRHQTGQLMSRATVDLQGVRFFLGYGLIFFFQNVLTVVSVTVVLFFFQWELALDRARDHAAARGARLPLQPRRAPDPPRRAAAARRRRDRRRGEHRRRPRREGVRAGARRAGEVHAPLRARLRPDAAREPAARDVRAAHLVRPAPRAGGGAARRRAHGRARPLCRREASARSSSTSGCSSCRCARSGCGSARRSARPHRASASSR